MQQQCSREGEYSHDANVVYGTSVLLADVTKYPLRQDLVATHSEEQPRSAGLAGEPAAETRDDQDACHGLEKNRAADSARDVQKRRLEVGKSEVIRPDPLSKI